MIENEKWKLAWIHVHTKPVSDEKALKNSTPGKADQLALLKKTLSLLDIGAQENNFSRLYDSAADSWKALHSKEKTEAMFSTLSIMELDFSIPEPFVPTFDESPHIDKNGILFFKGHYKNRSGRRYFEVSYVLENGQWKMASLVVNWDHVLPSRGIQIMLVKETMEAFAQAVLSRDFTRFYETRLALPFQKKYSKDAFQNIFKPFMDQNVDLRGLDGYTPEFDEKPKFDKDGLMILKGYFSIHPRMTIFDMKFMKVREDWKLMRLYINIKPATD
jgi:hypothetical protein